MVSIGTETVATVFAERMISESADKKQKIQVVIDRVRAGDSTSDSSQKMKLDSSMRWRSCPFYKELPKKEQ